MKTSLYFILFIFSFRVIQAQNFPGKIKLNIQDRITSQSLTNFKARVAINQDTTDIVTDAQGYWETTDLNKGTYDIYVITDTYIPSSVNVIRVGEGKTVYVTVQLIPNRKLTKKEKKQFGL